MSDHLANEEGRAEGTGAPAGALEKTVEFDFDKIEDTAPQVVETPSKHDPEVLNAHIAAGHELIPLRHWQAKDTKGKPAGKFPKSSGWRRQPALSLAKAVARMKAGCNVGARLRDIDLVIDVDPRNFAEGDDPFARLVRDFGLSEAPFVRTGGGGFHHYYRKPADMPVLGELAAYPGVEFKSLGRQVVAAGSVHPNGSSYGLDDDILALSLAEAPEATTALLDAIAKPSVAASTIGSGEITPAQLERLLSKLDVAAYNGRHDDWLAIMMAAHHGTDGAGVDEFVAWSVGDPDYAGDEDRIRGRWASLTIKAGGVTLATLLKALSDAGLGAFIEEVLRSCGGGLPERHRPAGRGRRAGLLDQQGADRAELPQHPAGHGGGAPRGRLRRALAARCAAGRAAALDGGHRPRTNRRPDPYRSRVDHGAVRPRAEREDVSDVLFALATKNTFNPVVEYLDGLAWDGVSRIDSLFPAYFGSPDSAYERAAGRKLMLAAVRRMRRPGTKFDTVPIVEGRQGSGKTSALRILGGMWHSDAELGRLDGKDSAGALHGVWIMELGELTAMNKAEVENLKAFVTRTEDRYRPPYGRTVKTFPRRCVFIGTTNSASYLRDHTGNRRYLPVSTGDIDLDALKRDRDQLWAEAAILEAAGESLTLPSSLWSDAADRQGDRQVDDPWLDRLRLHLASSPGRTRFSSQELLEFALEVPCSRQNQTDAKRVAVLMAKLGWQHKANLRFGKQSMTGYVSPEDPTFKA
ncbi:VapE domain-containing protein [Aureimonas populi]|uniref:VapE domain-containing protein n=1 Tax=Aureimonas populi TaxID=1701758 RepID=A0ABW5CP75_9HYPH|nr:VapE domain-containing protein [Aureimonas populi]